MADELEMAVAPDDVIEGIRRRVAEKAEAADAFAVWHDCWDALMFFLSLRGQWSFVGGMSIVRTGLPSTHIEAEMRLAGIRGRKRRQLFEDLRAMESVVLATDHELRLKEKEKT